MKFSVKDGCPECPTAGFYIMLFDDEDRQLRHIQKFDTNTMLGVTTVSHFIFGYPAGHTEIRDKLLQCLPPEWHDKIVETRAVEINVPLKK